MKIRLLSALLICALSFAIGVRAEDAKEKEDQTELGSKMEKINGAYRKLGRQISDATKNDDSLKQIAIIKENADAAMKLEPALKAEKPAADQAKFVADYQAKMKGFIADVGKLETALKAGKNDEAATLMNTLKQDQKEGHTEFRKQQKKKG